MSKWPGLVRFYQKTTAVLDRLQAPFLLLIRLYIGWLLIKSGTNKLQHLDTTAEFFASLNIPLPQVNACLSGVVESLGGLLLVLGLASRVAGLAVAGNMLVAYATAHTAELRSIFADTNRFLKAPPFLYLLTAVIVLLFGAGTFSLDALVARWMRGPESRRD